jgi:hypothetical protein
MHCSALTRASCESSAEWRDRVANPPYLWLGLTVTQRGVRSILDEGLRTVGLDERGGSHIECAAMSGSGEA